MVRQVRSEDAKAITEIYNYYIQNTVFTFEEETISFQEISERIRQVEVKYPWLVYTEQDKVVGYAYANQWKGRSAYRYAVEISIYMDPEYTGKGIGSKLMKPLLEELKLRDFHCIIGGISLPNKSSIALHEKFGFHQVAQFEKVGYKFDKWLDVGYWQLNI